LSDINCKGYEYDFIRAVIYFFIDSGNYNKPQKGIYLKALPIIESFISQFPEDELGYYLKGRIITGLEKYDEAIKTLIKALEINETSRTFYRIGRLKEDKLNQSGIYELHQSILMYPSSLCCNRWFKEISDKRKIILSSNTKLLSNLFSNKSKNEYLTVLYNLKKQGSVNLNTGKTLSTLNVFEDFCSQLRADESIFFQNNSVVSNKMTYRADDTINQLSKSIEQKVIDYRSDENDETLKVDEIRIKTWVNQFEENNRIPILRELDKILETRYCSKEKMIGFLSSLMTELSNNHGYKNDVKSFLSEVLFLNLQPKGKSQGIILNLLNDLLQKQYNMKTEECGKNNIRFFIYLDDILCTGLTLVTDITEWSDQINKQNVKNRELIESGNAKLIFAYAFSHKQNFQKKITQIRLNISNYFAENCHLMCLTEIDNTLEENSPVDLVFPSKIPEKVSFTKHKPEDTISIYERKIIEFVDTHNKQYNYVSPELFFRPTHLPIPELFYTSARNRILIENAFLEKGIEILSKVRSASVSAAGKRRIGAFAENE
jgi:tetratricopeptide (TPR) repeat protein